MSSPKTMQDEQQQLVPLGRVAARLAKHVEVALGNVDLSLPQYRVLIMLGGGSAAASVLASRLSVSPPSVTAIVDGLVARGFVNRRSDGGDRRRVTHELTEKGRRMLTQADAEVDSRFDEVLGHLPPRERQRAAAGLRLWIDAMDGYVSTSLRG